VLVHHDLVSACQYLDRLRHLHLHLLIRHDQRRSRVNGWAKAIFSDSLKILYFVSLTEEMEYITTKNANIRVMKSA